MSEPLREVVDEVQAEMLVLGAGPAQDADEEVIFRYMRWKGRLADERARIEAWVAAELRRLGQREHAADYLFKPAVEAAVRRKLAHSKTRTLHTPYGKLGFRKQPELLQVVDKDAFEAYATHTVFPDATYEYRREFVVHKDQLNALYQRDGEVPPGCEVRPAGDKFFME